MQVSNSPLRVMHIISGDLWAGAEAQAFTLLKYLSPHVELSVVLMNDGELASRLRAINVQVTVLPEATLSSLKILFKLIAVLRRFRPDLIHTHRQKENILGNVANVLAALTTGRRATSVRTCHGAPEFNPHGMQRLQVMLDLWVGRYLQRGVIAVSGELANKLAVFFPRRKIFVIENGVDIPALKNDVYKADFFLEAPHARHIGIVGRLEKVKRVDIFLAMAALLCQRMPSGSLQFHIIGFGRMEKELREAAERLTVPVNFHGHRSDIASCLNSLDVLVMCSDHEGMPMTGLEAIALGTPLVAHNVGGLHDLLETCPQLLVDEHSPDGYADKVEEVLRGDITINLSLATKYSAEFNMREMLNLYIALS